MRLRKLTTFLLATTMICSAFVPTNTRAETTEDQQIVYDSGETGEIPETYEDYEEEAVADTVNNTVDAIDLDGVKATVVRISDSETIFRNTDLSQIADDLEPGQYTLTIEKVPKGYFIIQKDNDITVTTKGDKTPFRIAVGTTQVKIKAKDKDSGREITGVTADIVTANGATTYSNVELPFTSGTNNPMADGDYVVIVKSAPDGYIPEQRNITVEKTLDPQEFSVALGHTKINIHAVNDATDAEVANVKGDLLNANGNKVFTGITLPFNVTTSDDAAYVAPGKYTFVTTQVPDGYVKPDDIPVNVREQEAEQPFEVRLKKTSITVKAVDKGTKEELSGVAATIFNSEGEKIKTDTDLRYVGNYVAKGNYKIHITTVPAGYALPDDTTITVKETDKKQVFTIPVDYTKVKVNAVDKKTGNPVSVVRATMFNSNSHEIWTNAALAKSADHVGPGNYKIKTLSVPDGYLLPSDTSVTVKQTASQQNFNIVLDYTKAAFSAVDAKTGKTIDSGVTATIYDQNGKAVARDVSLRYAREYLTPGKHTIHVTKVPEGYVIPADKVVDVKAVADQQQFSISIEQTNVRFNVRDKYTNNLINRKVSMYIENKDGRAVAVWDTNTGWKEFSKIPAGSYSIVFDKVPAGYKKPGNTSINIKSVSQLQVFDTYLELQYQKLLATAIAGNKTETLSWNKIYGADGYDIYLTKCGNPLSKKIKTIKGNKKFSYKVKNLKNGREYKAKVYAWRIVEGKKKVINKSPEVHSIVKNTAGRYTNAKAVAIRSRTKVTLKKGKKTQMKAVVTKCSPKKTLFYKNHTAKLRYYSENPYIAKVNAKGMITGKSSGTCKIFALAPNGVKNFVTVTVK